MFRRGVKKIPKKRVCEYIIKTLVRVSCHVDQQPITRFLATTRVLKTFEVVLTNSFEF